MPLQFAPPPSFAEPKNLVPEIKLPSVQRPNIPLRNLSTAPDDDDKTRDMMLAMILGASTPLFEKGAVALAEKIPGISGLLEPKEVEQPQPSGADRLDMLRVRAKELFPEDAIARQGWVKGQQAARAAIPDSPVPPKDTLTKSAVKILGGLAPAAALKTSAGAGVFADMYGKGLKVKSDEALLDAQARLETIKARKKVASDVSKKYFESQEDAVFHFIDPNTLKQKTRNVVQVGEDIFVKSHGEAGVDLDLNKNVVPRGKLYLNPIITSWGSTLAKPLDEHGTYYNKKTQEFVRGKLAHTFNPETSSWTAEPVVKIGGKYQSANEDWLRVNPGTPFAQYKQAMGKIPTAAAEAWADLFTGDSAAAATLYGISELDKLLVTPEGETALTDTAALAEYWDGLGRNINALSDAFGDDPSRIIQSDAYNKDEKKETLRLYNVLTDYQLDPNDPAAERAFLKELETWATKTNNKYAGNWRSYTLRGKNLTTGQLDTSIFNVDQEVLKKRARIWSLQLQLAYKAAATSGQTGRTLSDKDLAHFLQVVGFGIKNPNTLRALQADFANDLLHTADRINNPFKKQINDAEATEDYVTSVLKVDDALFDEVNKPGTTGDQARREIKRQASEATGGLTLNFYQWVERDDGVWEFIMLPFQERFFDPKHEEGVLNYINKVKIKDSATSTGAPSPSGEAGGSDASAILG